MAVATPAMLPTPIVAANEVMNACSGESGPLAPLCRLAIVSRIASRKRKICTNRNRIVKIKLVAISTICTHLGCIPNWLGGENKFKCPCHGSGYYMSGINFEGPTPRPLERFAIAVDPDGYVVVDQSRIYRSELGEWENPESFIAL